MSQWMHAGSSIMESYEGWRVLWWPENPGEMWCGVQFRIIATVDSKDEAERISALPQSELAAMWEQAPKLTRTDNLEKASIFVRVDLRPYFDAATDMGERYEMKKAIATARLTAEELAVRRARLLRDPARPQKLVESIAQSLARYAKETS